MPHDLSWCDSWQLAISLRDCAYGAQIRFHTTSYNWMDYKTKAITASCIISLEQTSSSSGCSMYGRHYFNNVCCMLLLQPQRKFTRVEVAACDGEEGRPLYIIAKDCVYDITSFAEFVSVTTLNLWCFLTIVLVKLRETSNWYGFLIELFVC